MKAGKSLSAGGRKSRNKIIDGDIFAEHQELTSVIKNITVDNGSEVNELATLGKKAD